MPTKKKTAKKEEEAKEVVDELTSLLIMDSSQGRNEKKVRLVSLYGNIDEEKAEEACLGLMALKEIGEYDIYENPDDPASPIVGVGNKPIELYVSTWGGSAADMFSIYDTIRLVRESCDVKTLGMGKVMSAGVLLLAAGTKGQRRIGKNCRVMMHSVIGGHHGAIHHIENEMEEIRWIQEQHVSALVKETDMTKKYLNKLLDRKVNAYIRAEEAVELGIADIIV